MAIASAAAAVAAATKTAAAQRPQWRLYACTVWHMHARTSICVRASAAVGGGGGDAASAVDRPPSCNRSSG